MEKPEVFPFILGENIDLVAINLEHINLYAKWINDPRVRRYARNTMPITVEESKKWFEPREGIKEFVSFEIYHKELDKIVGFVEFNQINYINHAANLSVVIGEKEIWGNNLGTEAAKQMIKYGFNELNLVKITASTLKPNKGACRMLEKIGMKLELVLKNQTYFDGMYADELNFCISREEWEQTNK